MAVSIQLQAQTHTFEIRLGSHAIGTVEARCNVNGNARHLEIKSKLETTFITKFTDIYCDYNNNVLVQSHVTRSSGKNSDDSKNVTTRREGNRYLINADGEKSALNNVEIQHSVSDLYFAEPRQISRVYSETLGKFLALKALGNGEYELSLPDGKKNYYRYQKGTLKEVEVNHTLGKAFIVRTS
ncbi:MAG TPA: DUF6134 family protein [Chitinophaga sp.]|uniref:DUF6134 family protein n=1 Tax=Chitinophaga sp. TaxID=1869181 RepID=UPI002DB86085|nr:DUF6134 family protein [Chitinophaga sp.]HEU4553956.1 DUF6134 family protein [Chitinophaga sp.]